MPVIFRHRDYRFFFYSNEGSPREPIHVHVRKGEAEAKFWLRPEIRIACNDGYDARSSRQIMIIMAENRDWMRGPGMNSSVRATCVRFDNDSMWVFLADGRTIGVPLASFPRLLNGTVEQREQVTITSRGLHWDGLAEDISVAGLLAGLGDQAASGTSSAA